jgi:hypothetical protein
MIDVFWTLRVKGCSAVGYVVHVEFTNRRM